MMPKFLIALLQIAIIVLVFVIVAYIVFGDDEQFKIQSFANDSSSYMGSLLGDVEFGVFWPFEFDPVGVGG